MYLETAGANLAYLKLPQADLQMMKGIFRYDRPLTFLVIDLCFCVYSA
jgi:hypothetical protein